LTTTLPTKSFAAAVSGCAACLDKDPLRHHPGRMRITRTPDAVVLATATRTEKVKIEFRIPCESGETWTAVVDATGTSRLAKALRPLAGGKKNGNATIAIDRAERSLVLGGGGQRLSIPACEPMIEETAAAAGETFSVVGAADLAERIAAALTFCNPTMYQTIGKGPFVYFHDAEGGLVVPAVVATDGHRLFVDGDARDCSDAKFVFQVAADDWKPAAKALDTRFDTVRLVRTAVPRPTEEEPNGQEQKYLTRLVFESTDRQVEMTVEEPQTSLPHWAGFLPRETSNPDLSITCDRDELAAAVKAVSSVSAAKGATCMLRADPTTGVLRILAQTDFDGGMAQQEIAAEVRQAPAGYVHLNGKYVLDALGAVRTDQVRLCQDAFPLDAVRFIEVASEKTELRPRGIVTMPVRGHDPVDEADEAAGGPAETSAVTAGTEGLPTAETQADNREEVQPAADSGTTATATVAA
jgi:hypothetical protein